VYGGRLPLASLDALKKFKSNQSPAVIVVVYGNREIDDALLELKEIVEESGFKVIAGAAFIGEHSYSTEKIPLAPNRPDKQDLIKCGNFAAMITEKFKNFSQNSFTDLNIPGQHPYKERKDLPLDAHPITDKNLCDNCGLCVDLCPTNAISNDYIEITDGALCIHCCACVKSCPNGARIFDHPAVNSIKDRLFLTCSERKEPTYFI
jgi:ferredoxin